MLFRVLVLLAPLVTAIAPAPQRPGPVISAAERSVVRQAALALTREPAAQVARRLRRDSSVMSAGVGLDGKSVSMTFSNGTPAIVLPAPLSKVRERGVNQSGQPMVRAKAAADGPRAVVLEPFYSELGLAPSEGAQEASDLESAGFQVDQKYDSEVDVATMASLSQYSVVYMLVHSGVNQYGEGVIATGEVVQDGPAPPDVAPYLADHTVMVTGVAGSTTEYYGVLSGFFQNHEATFPSDSLIFINGCSLLKASRVWNALASKGVGSMVTWDDEVMSVDEEAAASAFLNAFLQGDSVADSVAAVLASGHGRSYGGPNPAQIGYLGDGALTLPAVLDPPPTPTPTPTSPPTLIPTAAPTPTPTASEPAGLPPVPSLGSVRRWHLP